MTSELATLPKRDQSDPSVSRLNSTWMLAGSDIESLIEYWIVAVPVTSPVGRVRVSTTGAAFPSECPVETAEELSPVESKAVIRMETPVVSGGVRPAPAEKSQE